MVNNWENLTGDALELLPRPAISYGKAAIVGVAADIEHGAAVLPPRMGKPIRAAIGGRHAIIPSNGRIVIEGEGPALLNDQRLKKACLGL